MPKTNTINTEILNNIIIGRVEPHIYAFSTGEIPSYLKVGDTYRPVETRLNEWRKHYPNLEKKFENVAKINEDTFFRDYAVHNYLEKDLERNRLKADSIRNIPYFSKEFFENATEKDLQDAIIDIKKSHQENNLKYQYYRFDESRVTQTQTYIREVLLKLRPNQEKTVTNFREAIKNKRTNLLMYAVMRFGKSFTSMCCAVEMDAKLVVIVSAKNDVRNEWKKTVESLINFEGFCFLEANDLLTSETIIADKQKANEKIVLFLTLQDLQGGKIKKKHAQVFENQIDLLLIDETHFGARASEYGKVLQVTKSELKSEIKGNDSTLEDLEIINKELKAKIRIHLSGTPYRILMNDEFTKEDIIAFYQFSDIADDQEKWDEENLSKDETKEWDNPYYGFPQMIRFAFNLNESSIKKLEELKNNGITYAFSQLFRPQSIILETKNQSHKKFVHEKEVLDLLKVIDGIESDSNILSFLDYDKIKEGKMCRHLVCVLPYRASCDAFEELIKSNKFIHLNNYEIINISGVEKDSIQAKEIQNKITKFESENKKTITLTVNKMLTGSTVPEWDTMLYLKDTASPQEYDQAIFRLQNQYIKEFVDDKGDVIKYNMKPQTLLVDFDPTRMFVMQEEKAQIYNFNTDKNGNQKLEERLERELEISPIITLNSSKLVQVKPSDILDAVRQYSSNRGVSEEAKEIPIDLSLLDIELIKKEIEKQNEIDSNHGLKIKGVKADKEGDDLEVPTSKNDENDENLGAKSNKEKTDELASIKKKFATYYSKILFFAFCTEAKIMSLQEIIDLIEKDSDSQRIAANLEINNSILQLMIDNMQHQVLSKLDYKIQNINSIATDTNLEPIERVGRAMKKFTRLSESEIVTPQTVTKLMIDSLPKDAINKNTKLLDIASKQGEFVYAVYKKFGKEIANNFYSIPTSKIAYEFTRKVYNLLQLDMKLIEQDYTSYDLIKEDNLIENETIKINNQKMKFDVIVGNPPYQQSEGGANSNTALPIYNLFVNFAKKHNPKFISLIIPTRWYAGGRGLDDFRDQMLNDKHISELHDFIKPELIFQNINLRGGICHFLWEKNFDNKKSLTKVFTYKESLTPSVKKRNLRTNNSDILIRHNIGVSIIEKVCNSSEFESLTTYVSAAKAFGFRTFFINDNRFRSNKTGLKNSITCFGRGNSIGYVEKSEVVSHAEWIDVWKIYVPESNNIGTELNDDNQNSFIGKPGTICTETFLVIGANLALDKISSENLCIYLKTKFARFMHSLAKISQHGTSKTYIFVPLQNFNIDSDIEWSKSVEDIDKQLYAKYNLSPEEIEFIESMIKPMSL
ncbi:MAG: Eco57I restriction-modification methylase domain-containing protein [Flavobacterium sp.]|uniref:Eco57I restriction-modification methylase domain-containing protein n=1 Tax=Flavobacterium sp. TaxID=239 RepID=UPI0022C7C8B7|nr:Eco57I restriction-modification methylase domain-containing protein [Flavobacterium sp.]MCZ8198385.1 Eco57I restriction-modification methylase domain-containing protein [Flavobacterium sp.]